MNRQTFKRTLLFCSITILAIAAIGWIIINKNPTSSTSLSENIISENHNNVSYKNNLSSSQTTNIYSKTNPYQQILVHNNRLSARIKQLSLDSLVSIIGTQAHVPIYISGEINSRNISGEVNEVPLAEGLLYLLREFDVFLFYGDKPQSSTSLKAVWVYPKHVGESLMPRLINGTDSVAISHSVTQSQVNATPSTRIKINDPNNATMEIVNALQSPDTTIRYSALATSIENQIELPQHVLQRIAESDAAANVRSLALSALIQNPLMDRTLVRNTAQLALKDSDLDIQAQAKGIIEYLDLAEKPN